MYNFNKGLLAYWLADTQISPFWLIPAYIIVIGISYLLGSINSAIIISKALYGDDVRKHGSGNAGMTNMLRTYGKGAAGLTILGDMMKTAIAIFVTGLFFGFYYTAGVSVQGLCYIAGLFVVIGHVFPCFHRFKGGKGVLATATMALILSPIVFLILFAIFVAIVWISKYLSLGSVTTAILYPIVLSGYFAVAFKASPDVFAALSTIILAILIVWCHRSNLVRIQNRTENKFSFGKSKKSEETAPTATDEDGEDDE